MASKETDGKSSGTNKDDQKGKNSVQKAVTKSESETKTVTIKNQEVKSVGGQGGVEKCSICSEGMFKDGPKAEDTLSTKCGHKFHKKCILKWFNDHTVCPVDRNECSVKFVGNEVDTKEETLAESLKLKVSVLDNFSIGNFFTPLKFDPDRKTDLVLLGFANMRPELSVTNFCIESNVIVILDGVILTVLKHWTPENDPMDDDLIIRGEYYPKADRIVFNCGSMERSLNGSEQYKNFIADTSSLRSKAHKERYQKFKEFILNKEQSTCPLTSMFFD